jgi:DNA-binding MarR family transcriptional regulator
MTHEDLQHELHLLFRHVARTDRDLPADAPLTATQRVALGEIFDAGPLRLHELAERMRTTPPTASRAVDALVSAGLVDRTPDPDDRRAVRIGMTRGGRTRVVQRRAAAARALRPAFARLPQHERAQLVQLMARLNDALSAELEAAA